MRIPVSAYLLCIALGTPVFTGETRAQAPTLPTIRNISVGVGEQVPSGFTGIGARGMAMGGAQMASVRNGTALFWNPAALTRTRRAEFLGGLTYLRPQTRTAIGENPQTRASTRFIRLNAAILTLPYPVYRGGLTFALGMARPTDYGMRARREGVERAGEKRYAAHDDIRQDGGLPEYAIGMGVEVSPTASVGISVLWYRGNADVHRKLLLLEQTTESLPDSLAGEYRQHVKITGASLLLGMTVRFPWGFHLAAAVRGLTEYSMEGTWGDSYEEAIGTQVYYYDYEEYPLEYRIKAPWQLGIGLAWMSYVFSFSADVWYTDWRQARFEGNPYGEGSGIDAETFFEDRYRQTVRVHLGGELLLPFIHTYVRAGCYRDPDPFVGPTLDSGQPIRYTTSGTYYAVGLGWLLGEALTVDATYLFGGDRYTSGALTERRSGRRVFLTFALRP